MKLPGTLNKRKKEQIQDGILFSSWHTLAEHSPVSAFAISSDIHSDLWCRDLHPIVQKRRLRLRDIQLILWKPRTVEVHWAGISTGHCWPQSNLLILCIGSTWGLPCEFQKGTPLSTSASIYDLRWMCRSCFFFFFYRIQDFTVQRPRHCLNKKQCLPCMQPLIEAHKCQDDSNSETVPAVKEFSV